MSKVLKMKQVNVSIDEEGCFICKDVVDFVEGGMEFIVEPTEFVDSNDLDLSRYCEVATDEKENYCCKLFMEDANMLNINGKQTKAYYVADANNLDISLMTFVLVEE